MNKRKKSPWWIVLLVCTIVVIVLAVSVGLHFYQIYHRPESSVEITGTIVDNHFNNYISEYNLFHSTGDFVRIGDKLYYNYDGSYETYGLYEITSNGAQRIHWDGHGPYPFLESFVTQLYPIREYHGKLLMNTTLVGSKYYVYNSETKEWELSQGRIQSYNEETHTFEETMLFGGISDIAYLTYQETDFGFVYRSKELTDLWVYTEEGDAEKIAEEVASFYAVEESIYYVTDTKICELHRFDWKSKTDTLIRQWNDYTNLSCIMIEEGQLIFMATCRANNSRAVYKLDLSNPANAETVVYSMELSDADSEYMNSFNVWDGTVYICTTEGLFACDLTTGEHRDLHDNDTSCCYIVDDTWVYFVESKSSSLWRVPQSGGDVELVLG